MLFKKFFFFQTLKKTTTKETLASVTAAAIKWPDIRVSKLAVCHLWAWHVVQAGTWIFSVKIQFCLICVVCSGLFWEKQHASSHVEDPALSPASVDVARGGKNDTSDLWWKNYSDSLMTDFFFFKNISSLDFLSPKQDLFYSRGVWLTWQNSASVSPINVTLLKSFPFNRKTWWVPVKISSR